MKTAHRSCLHTGIVECKAAFAMLLISLAVTAFARTEQPEFNGKFFRGSGDVEYLKFLDISRRMFAPDPEFQNFSMLYMPSWNGFVEGPTWDAWWIQNSYGTTYAALPLLQEPFWTFLQNAQDLWFDQMGDGKRVGAKAPFEWVAPDGCLCDCARPGWIVYKQGDGQTGIHDWAMEFTAAGIVLQGELLLIGRDLEQIRKYLPKLERSVAFIETRRGTNDLFLAGPAGNLLAPSYAGWKKPDGTYDKAYLTGLSVNYIAALNRMIELEKLVGKSEKARTYSQQRDSARNALAQVTTPEGYLIRSLDPDGVRHGVFGAPKHGYLETSPNHDAIAFNVVDRAQAEKIYAKIACIPGLRPHSFVLPNYPAYDDMYTGEHDIWAFGTWVNGGHWSTCEARMILAYYRLGKFEDARRSMRQLMKFAEAFRMDNPLTKFGDDVYQPGEAINLCYDSFGPPAALLRGLFEYSYTAEGLKLRPQIPPGITQIEQKFPVRFGQKQLFISAAGSGPIKRVEINGKRWKQHDAETISLPYELVPGTARIAIALGKAKVPGSNTKVQSETFQFIESGIPAELAHQAARLQQFCAEAQKQGLGDRYETAHARLALQAINTIGERQKLVAGGKLKPLPERTQKAADQSYVDAAKKLYDGLDAWLKSREKGSTTEQRLHAIWSHL